MDFTAAVYIVCNKYEWRRKSVGIECSFVFYATISVFSRDIFFNQ